MDRAPAWTISTGFGTLAPRRPDPMQVATKCRRRPTTTARVGSLNHLLWEQPKSSVRCAPTRTVRASRESEGADDGEVPTTGWGQREAGRKGRV